ncbi:unnamed protein product [Cunninghamella blakesleeana]
MGNNDNSNALEDFDAFDNNLVYNNPPINKNNNTEPYSVLTNDDKYLSDVYTMNLTTLPLYKINIQDKEYNALIDSGASENYVSSKLVPHASYIQPIKNRSIEVANGTVVNIDKAIYIELNIDGYKKSIMANVFDSKFDIILGRTWLQQEKPIPDWTTDQWTIEKDNRLYHGGRSYNADIKYNLKYLIILTDINIEEITSEYRKIMAKYWSFYSNNWPIIPESKYHRSQIKEIVDINIIKSFLLERLGVIPVYFFLVVVFGRQDYAAPYNNVEKGLLLLYHLMQGYSIAEMARFMPKTTFYNLYKEFYIKQCDELHRLLDNCLIHMFSNVKVRILCANNNNPVKFKNVTLMIDGHDNRACYTKGHNYAKTFSYKLKKSGFRTQACIDINGMVLFLSNSVHCGENNDGSMLSSIDLNNVVSPYDVVALDGGYTQYITSIIDNNKHLTKKNFMKPIRKQRNVDLPVPDMAFNKEFGSFRSMIENTFGEIGSIFKRFNNSTVIRVSDINIFSLQFKLACVLINIKRFVKLGGLPHEEHHAYWLQHGFDYNGFVDRPMEEHTSLETILEDMNDMNDMQQKFLSMNMSSPEPVNLYEVEKILNHRVTENGPEYLVKWTGYDEVDSTWETLSAFNGTQCIDEYHAMND